jgi:hypothetical protein
MKCNVDMLEHFVVYWDDVAQSGRLSVGDLKGVQTRGSESDFVSGHIVE